VKRGVMPHHSSGQFMPRPLVLLLVLVVALALGLYLGRGLARPKALFQPGDRVRVNQPDFWAHGMSGTVVSPSHAIAQLADGWCGYVRLVETTSGKRPFYWVTLDEARREADGDGPYQQAEIAETYLQPLSAASRP
jgi:hypothetical protein